METSDKVYIYLLDLFGCLNCCSKRGNTQLKEIKANIDKGFNFLEKDIISSILFSSLRIMKRKLKLIKKLLFPIAYSLNKANMN